MLVEQDGEPQRRERRKVRVTSGFESTVDVADVVEELHRPELRKVPCRVGCFDRRVAPTFVEQSA
jgi:hypothetical protein